MTTQSKTHKFCPAARIAKALLLLVAALFLLTGCATHPLGMSDEEWNRLTPEQQLRARQTEEANQLKRQELRAKEEQRKKKEQARKNKAEGLLYRYHPKQAYCMGGDKCPKGNYGELILSLNRMAYVDKIEIHVDANVGRKHNGRLSVFADRVRVAHDIKLGRKGEWHQILVARKARNITLRAQGNDEVRVHVVKVYGTWAKPGKQYIIVK